MEQQEAFDRRNLEKCVRERDSLRIALEEERQLRENDDEEMRRKLKVRITLIGSRRNLMGWLQAEQIFNKS